MGPKSKPVYCWKNLIVYHDNQLSQYLAGELIGNLQLKDIQLWPPNTYYATALPSKILITDIGEQRLSIVQYCLAINVLINVMQLSHIKVPFNFSCVKLARSLMRLSFNAFFLFCFEFIIVVRSYQCFWWIKMYIKILVYLPKYCAKELYVSW